MRAAKARADAAGQGASVPVIAMKRPDNGLPEDIREHMRLMCDIVALGFQTDKTRLSRCCCAAISPVCSIPSWMRSSPTIWRARG